jgi:PAS domain S-box-containing protein
MAVECKEAERNTPAGEQLFRASFMAMEEGAILHSASGEVVAVNPAAENILGRAAAELIGRPSTEVVQALDFVTEEEAPLSLEIDAAMRGLQTGNAQRRVWVRAHRPDGTRAWISVSVQPLAADGESGPHAVLTTFRDVTERKRTEDALSFVAQRGWLAGKENFFEALVKYLGTTLGVEYAIVGRLTEDPGIAETVALYARGAVVPNLRYRLQGTPCENVMGRRFCFYPQGIRQMFPEDTLLVEMGAESYSGLPLWDSAGQPIGLIAVLDSKPLRDEAQVSQILQFMAIRAAAELERERNDRTLRQSEREFRSLAENMPDNVIRHDRQARVQYMNPALIASLAPEVLPVLGEAVTQTYPGNEDAAMCERVVEQVIATGAPAEIEFWIPNRQGEMRLNQVRYVAERDGSGEIVGALGIGRDITESKLAEEYEKFRSRTLELVSGGHPLPAILEGIVRGVEQLKPDMICSILLLDRQGKRLGDGVAPSLPDFYTAAVNGIEIGVGVGCCGTAAATGQRVITEDITVHPYWAPYKDLVTKAGLGACWSEPILSSSGQVLGTFAVYHRDVYSPTVFDISIIEKSTRLVSIAIERKRAEEALHASEQEFRTLAENLPDVLIRYDRDGRRTFVNRALKRELAVTAEQLLGKTLRETNPTAMAMPETYQRALEHTLATGERSEFEVQVPLPDGNTRTGLCFIVAERAADGRISGAISVGRDITERKRMESEIRRREREFRSLAESSPDPIFRYDRECRRIYANPASGVLSGYPVESLIGATPADGQLLAADYATSLTTGIRRVFDTGEPGCVETASVDRDGRRREYQVLLAPEPDDQGRVVTVLGLARDITAIRDAERRMTEFVANLPGFAFTFRLSPEGHGSFPFASPGIEELVGLKPADVRDDMAPLLARAHPDDAPRLLVAIGESARTLTPYHEEARACRPGLPTRWVELRGVPLRQGDGSVLWHGIMLDIDERKRNEAELERHRYHLEHLVKDRTRALMTAKETAEAATRAKSHFLAAASHDLRQPIAAIGFYNDALARSELNEIQKRISSSLAKSVDKLAVMLNELLDISRLDAGKLAPQPATIQFAELLGTIASEFDSAAREKHLRLKCFCPRGNLALFTDRNLLLTILRNLVGNAVKYTKHGGILVGIRRRGDRALIQVWDTGIGIAHEQLDLIFEEYFQADNPGRDRARGAGFGLAIVRRVSEALHSRVSCRSRLGRGSVFEFSLPLARGLDRRATPVPARAAGAISVSGRLAGKRIVIIEDDATAAEAIKLSLAMAGAHVTLFGTAEDALQSAEAMAADHYISDYRLPEMDGLQLLDAIQVKSAKPIKAVLLTGNTSPDQVAITRSSRWKVLFKPIALTELLSAMEL